MGFANQTIDSCVSTNDLLKQLAERGYPHGTWVSARRQESGRGRLGRRWESPPGNLFLSYLARIEPLELWSWIPLTTAVAVVRCLSQLFPKAPFRIKWPNDLWVSQPDGEAKLGGILCEGSTSRSRGGPFVIVGLGLNCASAPDEQSIGQRAQCLSSLYEGISVSADDVRAPLLQSLNASFDRLSQEGTAWVPRDYEKYSLLSSNCIVTWGDPPQEGTVLGLGNQAELIIRDRGGNELRLFAEDVRLLRKKSTP